MAVVNAIRVPVFAVLVMMSGAGVAAAATVFTDRTAWASDQKGPLTVETFATDIATANCITFGSGIVSTKSSSGIPPTLNRVSMGSYDGFVVRDGYRSISWELPKPAKGFGGDFGGGGTALNSLFVTTNFVAGGSKTYSLSDTVQNADGFFGLSSRRAFSSLLFTTDAGVVITPGAPPFGGQSFGADNVVVAAVPLPAALPLMLGVLGVGGVLRLSRRCADA